MTTNVEDSDTVESDIGDILKELPELLADPVFVLDTKGTIVWTNDAMEEYLRAYDSVERSQLTEWIVSLIDRAPEPARGELTGRNEKPVISVADNLGRPDWYTVQVFPALYRDKPARTIVLNNVTDLKNQEKKLHEANTLIEHRMNHDARTGLASERRFFNRLRRALRLQDDEERVGLIVIELQDVEEISQQHGPEALDEVLQELAVNMLENLQDKQLVGRVGTGRFAILYQEVTNDAELLGRAILGIVHLAFLLHQLVELPEGLVRLDREHGFLIDHFGDSVDAEDPEVVSEFAPGDQGPHLAPEPESEWSDDTA